MCINQTNKKQTIEKSLRQSWIFEELKKIDKFRSWKKDGKLILPVSEMRGHRYKFYEH